MIMTPQCPCVISSSVKTNVVLSTPEHKYGALGCLDYWIQAPTRLLDRISEKSGYPRAPYLHVEGLPTDITFVGMPT